MDTKVIPGAEVIAALSKLFTQEQLEIVAKCINAELQKEPDFDDLILTSTEDVSDGEYLEYVFSVASQS